MRFVVFFLFLFVFSARSYADVYEFRDGSKRNVRILEDEDSLLHLETSEFPMHNLPVFIYHTFDYDIKRTFHPHKLSKVVLKESKFLLEKGNNYYSKKDYLNAIRYYEQSLRVNPEYIYAYHNIGVSYLLLSRYQETIKAFERLLNKHPDYIYAYLYIAVANMHLEMYDRARSYLEKAKAYPGILMDEQCNKTIEVLLDRVNAVMFPY